METLKTLTNTLQIYLFSMNLETLIIESSWGKLDNILGFDAEKEGLTSSRFLQAYFHPRDRNLITERIHLFRNGDLKCWMGIYRIRHRQGHWAWVFTKLTLLNSRGTPKLNGMMMDASLSLNNEDQISTLAKETLKLKNSERIKQLTHRELGLIKLIAKGFSYTQIAAQLHIQPDTVNKHRKNILRKLNLPNIATLVCFAKEVGLV